MADDWFAQQGPPGGGGGTGGGGGDWFSQYAPPGGGGPPIAFDSNGGWGQSPRAAAPATSAPGGSPSFNEQTGQYGPPPGLTAGAPGGGGAPASGNPTDPAYVRSQLANWYASQGLTPTGPGTGPTDIEYYTNKILETGGWTNQTAKGENNINYWTSRIPQDIAAAGGGGAAGGGAGAGGYGALSGGSNPLTQIAADALTTSPGYQFRLQQGQQGLERSAAAKGTLLTGGTAKALDRYNQDYASNEYANQYNRLFGEQGARYSQLLGLSSLGLTAAGQQANVGTTYANQAGTLLGQQATNTGNLLTQQGNAASAGTVGTANAWQQGLAGATTAGQNALQMYYLSKLIQPGTAPGNSPVGPYASGYQYPQ